jgi:transposase
MSTNIPSAKTLSGSWDAFSDVDAFVAVVSAELAAMKADGTFLTKRTPKAPLEGEAFEKAILSIWCVCFCGMQWRAAGRLSGIPFTTLYSLFARWTRRGLWRRLLGRLAKEWRISCGDTAEASALIIDSRSCRSSPTCGKRGIDGGKKVKGVKVHMAVDKHGFPPAIHISTANVHDTIGILPVINELDKQGFKGTLLGDAGYRGEKLANRAKDKGMQIVSVVSGAGGQFIPVGIRWVVERSFAWLSRYRRLNTIFERTTEHLVAFIEIAFISILSRRMARLIPQEN